MGDEVGGGDDFDEDGKPAGEEEMESMDPEGNGRMLREYYTEVLTGSVGSFFSFVDSAGEHKRFLLCAFSPWGAAAGQSPEAQEVHLQDDCAVVGSLE